MNIKKLIAALLSVVMVMTMSGCASDDNSLSKKEVTKSSVTETESISSITSIEESNANEEVSEQTEDSSSLDTEEDIEDEAPPLKETIVKAAKDHQETIHIDGTVDLGEDHAWNYIKLDDNYYRVDLTWDDPTYNGEKGFLSHSYFLFDDDLLYASRTIDEYFTSVPECSSMDMNYFVHNGCYFDHYDFDELEEASLRMATEKSVEFMFSDRETLEEAYNALIDGKDVWRLSAFLSYHTVNPFVVEDMNVLSLVFKNG